jgi:hypothetical protein
MTAQPPAGYGDPTCAHAERREGVCVRCGHCVHEIVLNAACLACGSTELDPIAMSPKRVALIEPQRLVRGKP